MTRCAEVVVLFVYPPGGTINDIVGLSTNLHIFRSSALAKIPYFLMVELVKKEIEVRSETESFPSINELKIIVL